MSTQTNPVIHTRTGMTAETVKQAMLDNLSYVLGKDREYATNRDYYMALSYTVRDRLSQRWLRTQQRYEEADAKTVYYLSAEYLMGRQLGNNLLNLNMTDTANRVMDELGVDMNAVLEAEVEPGLGNGGLGRLAACFLDSLATLGIPAVGYGIRYEFGIFRQTFEGGWQVEKPDDWLRDEYPWEFPHPENGVEIGFGGRTDTYTDEHGRFRVQWTPDNAVVGVPYTILVPGYRNETVNSLRLWRARASQSFNLQMFNAGDYVRAVEDNIRDENISKVLYPEDSTPQGKELRLQQQYFFVACSLYEIVTNFRARYSDWNLFPDKVAIQLNDSHPDIAVAELMRQLLDEHLLPWDQAWSITTRTFACTQHTLLPEALEQWTVSLLEALLPRHVQIIYEINRRFLDEVRMRYPGDLERITRMSIIGEYPEKRVRMVHLAVVASHSVNGVAELQSRLLRERVLHDFADLWPWKFNNKTNGVTPRRFVKLANPRLSGLITEALGSERWLTNADHLRELEPHADDAAFRAAWDEAKAANKRDLANHIYYRLGVRVPDDAIYDMMVKRLHEYKRQHLKTLHIVTLYNRIKANPHLDFIPRVVLFGAKAAPGYRMAKLIIRLMNGVADVVNHDPQIGDRLKVVYLPNFDVSEGQTIYPAANISEQISLAGMEASGTGNMKFALNGALTVGTLDGANIEIRDLVGPENFFLFGLTTDQVFTAKASGYRPRAYAERDPELRAAIDLIETGHFSGGDQELFAPLVDSLLNHDPYMVCADYRAYIDTSERAATLYRDTEEWTRKSILNSARCGFFSSDRTIGQYTADIWHALPVGVPAPE